MKILFHGLALCLSLALCACGSSQKSTNDLGEEMSDSKAHNAWRIDPSSRSIGNGQHFREQAAINIAELQARAALARKLSTAIKYTAREEFGGDQKFVGNNEVGKSVSEHSEGNVDRVEAISREIVKDASIIEISRFKQKDNQYNAYVCVGYIGGKKEMAEKAYQALEQLIPDGEKQKIRDDRDKIIKNIQASFDKK